MLRPSPPSWRAWRRSTPARFSGPRCGGRESVPGPATWCCSRRPARRMISSVTSRTGASSSRRWSGSWHERVRRCRSARRAPEVGAAPARVALRPAVARRRADPAHVRRGDGVQRERGVRRRAPRRYDVVLQAAGDRGFDRADRAPGGNEARLSPDGGPGAPAPVRVAGAARPDALARAQALGGRGAPPGGGRGARSRARKQEQVRTFSVGFLPHMVMLALFGFLLMLEPDFGTAVVLAAVTFALLFVAGAPLRYLLAVAGAAAPVAAVLIWSSPYRIQRVLTFLDPWKDPRGPGYQTVESLLGFGAGGSLGV